MEQFRHGLGRTLAARLQIRRQLIAQVQLYHGAGRAGVGKGVQALVVPVEQGFLAGIQQVGHMNFDGFALTDTIKAANALFQQVRVLRQIEQNQVVGKLEVAPFTANF